MGEIREPKVRQAVLELGHLRRDAVAHVECDWTFPAVCVALDRVPQRAWDTLRPVMDGVVVRGSGGVRPDGQRPTFGDVVRERTPRPSWDDPTRTDDLLALMTAVEEHQGAYPQWRALEDFLELQTIAECDKNASERPLQDLLSMSREERKVFFAQNADVPITGSRGSAGVLTNPGPGPAVRTTFWLAGIEVARWICARHRGSYGRLDGHLSGPLCKAILEALGWRVTDSARDLRKKILARWKAQVAGCPSDVKTLELGHLRFVATPTARRLIERSRRSRR